jgi:hypothetical protein
VCVLQGPWSMGTMRLWVDGPYAPYASLLRAAITWCGSTSRSFYPTSRQPLAASGQSHRRACLRVASRLWIAGESRPATAGVRGSIPVRARGSIPISGGGPPKSVGQCRKYTLEFNGTAGQGGTEQAFDILRYRLPSCDSPRMGNFLKIVPKLGSFLIMTSPGQVAFARPS